MPKEIKDKEQFSKLLKDADEVRVFRMGEGAKVKARMKDGLYTFKTSAEEADLMVKGLKAPVLEF